MFKINIEVASDRMSKRDANVVSRGVMQALARHHQREILPKHFRNVPETYPGAGGYRYRKRSKKWEQAKLKKYGHNRPNFAAGTMEQTVLSTSKITATATRWRLYARLPSVMRRGKDGRILRKRGSKKPVFERVHPEWQKDEIQIVSEKEKKEYARMYRRLFLRGAKSPRFKRKRKARAGSAE